MIPGARLLDGLPAERSLGQVRFADRGFGDRLLPIGCTNPIERSMRGAHVSTGLMPRQRHLLRVRARGVGEELYLFDRATELRFTETKANELED